MLEGYEANHVAAAPSGRTMPGPANQCVNLLKRWGVGNSKTAPPPAG